MSFGRRNLRLRFHKGVAIPIYLTEKDRPLLAELIRIYEESVGEPVFKLDKELVMYIVGDDRLARGLMHVMRRFYRGEPPPEAKDIKVKRLRVFRLVNTLYRGFVPSERRGEFLEKLKELGITSPEELWADEPAERRLVKVRECTPKALLRAYNYEVIDTILTNSISAEIEYLRGPYTPGLVTKSVLKEAKRYGLLYDARTQGKGVKISIEGPLRLFGHPTRYGRRISFTICNALRLLYNSESWRVYALMRTGSGRVLRVLIASERLKPAIELPEERPTPIYDSAAEEKVAQALWAIGFKVAREPEPLILGEAVMIPDFMIMKDGKWALVELAGYWRKEYALKKAYKVAQALRMGFPLIVLADEKLREYMPKSPHVIYYTLKGGRPRVPYGRLVMEFKKIGVDMSKLRIYR